MKEMYPATAILIVSLVTMALPIALNFFLLTSHQFTMIMIGLWGVTVVLFIWWEIAVWKNSKL